MRMFCSLSSVAAMTRNEPSRSPGSYSRCSQCREPSAASRLQLGLGLGRHEHDLAVAGEQALDLLEADLAAADHQAPPAPQPQAGDVERGVEHVPHAGLVADPATELADALLTGIGLSWHRP